MGCPGVRAGCGDDLDRRVRVLCCGQSHDVTTLERRGHAWRSIAALPTGRSREPKDEVARANWLPAPEGQIGLIVRAYVPTQPGFDRTYKLPNVERQTP